MFKNSSILITGGTGSFGKNFVPFVLKKYKPKKLIIFSRDEMKQWHMNIKYQKFTNIKFVIGDVRDMERVKWACQGVDYIVHAAATKIVPTAEYNPTECIQTNIDGANSVINAARSNRVKKVIALSTDKACNPVNLYGASKLVSDKLFIAANIPDSLDQTEYSVVRYGNVMGSRGSIIPFFLSLKKNQSFPITEKKMTRFLISLDDAVKFVDFAFKDMKGGEIYVKKIPSVKIVDIA
jgi:UDP-N-acetylglucosamine 4,6-dehydratase/5-epimerase